MTCEDSNKLIGVFEMLVNRLTNVEEKLDTIMNQQAIILNQPIYRTELTRRWIKYFQKYEIVCLNNSVIMPIHLLDKTFTIINPVDKEKIKVIVYDTFDITYKELSNYAKELTTDIEPPYIVISRPLFPASDTYQSKCDRSQFKSAEDFKEWNKLIFHDKNPILGLMVVKYGNSEFDYSVMQLAYPKTKDNTYCLVWFDQQCWLHSDFDMSCSDKPIGYYCRGRRDWKNEENVWANTQKNE